MYEFTIEELNNELKDRAGLKDMNGDLILVENKTVIFNPDVDSYCIMKPLRNMTGFENPVCTLNDDGNIVVTEKSE